MGIKDRVGNPQRRGHAVHGRNAGPRRGPLDGIGQRRRSTEEQRTAVDRLDLAGDRLDLAVGPIPGRPVEERRQPESARLRQVGRGREDLLRGRRRYRGRRAPASLSALARSIGWTTLPGISSVSTGRRGGGAGVAPESSDLGRVGHLGRRRQRGNRGSWWSRHLLLQPAWRRLGRSTPCGLQSDRSA